MLEISNLRLELDAGLPEGEALVRRAIARVCNTSERAVGELRLLKRSVDARKKSDVHFVASYAFELLKGSEEALVERGAKAPANLKIHVPYVGYAVPRAEEPLPERPVVVGSGPAGLFAAWVLAKAGAKPILLERGECVEERLKSVAAFNGGGPLNPESNIQFGEGGAGTFSDGKLTTNIKNPRCKDVLHIFAAMGAPEEILWQAKPHIGTDRLIEIVRTMREDIIALGGEVRFGMRFDAARFEGGKLAAIQVFDVKKGEEYELPAADLVLACGHSARDTFASVRDAGLHMERKPFSVGVRIEHSQEMVNASQYGAAASHPALGAADYKLSVHLPNGRGVYTFCMCPGGEVVCAASEEGGVCVNGMSVFARDGRNANSAVLVGIEETDFDTDDVFAGVELQRAMERAAYEAAGRTYCAPAQRVGDFLARRAPAEGGVGVEPTYARGVAWCDLHEILPSFVAENLEAALPLFDKRLRGFASDEAVMTGVETRSSSPVRIVRDKQTFEAFFAGPDGQQVPCHGVYPCGEGAGYAGGIMSAAVDGLRVAEALLANRGVC